VVVVAFKPNIVRRGQKHSRMCESRASALSGETGRPPRMNAAPTTRRIYAVVIRLSRWSSCYPGARSGSSSGVASNGNRGPAVRPWPAQHGGRALFNFRLFAPTLSAAHADQGATGIASARITVTEVRTRRSLCADPPRAPVVTRLDSLTLLKRPRVCHAASRGGRHDRENCQP